MMSALVDGQQIQVQMTAPGTAAYSGAVALAKSVYSKTYNSTIDPKPHVFMVFTDGETNEVAACAGVSFAARERLFSEAYLDCSLEQALRGVFGYPVERSKVVEVTSLATKTPKLGSELVRVLPILLWFMGKQAIVCTITEKLQLMFAKHRLPFTVIAQADRSRVVPREGVDWGSYYDANPRTGVVRLDQIGHLFQRNCGRYNVQPADGRESMPWLARPLFEGVSAP